MKLLWAFNPFDANRKLERRAIALLRSTAATRDTIEAVYVASPLEVELATAFDVPIAERFSAYPKSLVEKGLAKLGMKRASATVLTQNSVSLTAAATAIANHAAKQKVEITVVASHARKGVPRLFLGSFAETLIHLSRTDLLVFHENSVVPERAPRTLLFAHDLSDGGDRGFERALAHAKRWKSTLHVMHVPE
jgi:nucleotide-binding universal stress UspA family protein